MANYDSKILQDFFDTRNYLGAADYLSTVKAGSPQKQIILNRQINQLRRDGEIQAAMLRNMTPTERQAFHFMTAINGNGTIPHTMYDTTGKLRANTSNDFGDSYINEINNIKTNDGVLLNRLGISINQPEIANDIFDILGAKDGIQVFNKYGIKVETDANTGAYNFSTTRDNKSLAALFGAVNKASINYFNKLTKDNAASRLDITKNYMSYFGTDSSGNLYAEDDINLDAIHKSTKLYNTAKDIYEKTMERLNHKEYDEEMYVTPFLGYGQANAYKRMKQGLISIDDYKKIVDERTNTYNTLLKQAGLDQQEEVYFMNMNDENSTALQRAASKDIRDLNRILLYAMDKNAVTYSAAMHGGQVGTYITISPIKEDDGTPVKDISNGYRLFIPGLFKSSCDESFENDTQTAAARDLADMKHWNYGKRLYGGDYVGWDENIGAYKYAKDINGKQVKVPISQEEALQKLNKHNIIQQSAEVLMANLDEDGNPLATLVQGKPVPYDISESAKTLAAVGVNELYPKDAYSEGIRLEAHNDIYNKIMEILKNVINNQTE